MKEQVNELMVMSEKELKAMRTEKAGQVEVCKTQDKTDAVVLKILALDKQIEVIDFYMRKRGIRK